LDVRNVNRGELEGRRNRIQQEKKAIEDIIQTYKVTEQASIESGDGCTAIASRKAVEVQEEQLERIIIEENAITKRLQEYEKNKPDAEKLKAEIEQLHNQTATKHVNEIIKAQNEIVENLKEIAVINNSIEDLAGQYLILCGETLYAPTILVPGALRQFARETTGLYGTSHVLQPVEPIAYPRKEENSQ